VSPVEGDGDALVFGGAGNFIDGGGEAGTVAVDIEFIGFEAFDGETATEFVGGGWLAEGDVSGYFGFVRCRGGDDDVAGAYGGGVTCDHEAEGEFFFASGEG